ncbi:hypothetical protein FNF29_06087 [Cafeteria roenbergensis]|uniref:GTP-binding protein n=1 Tax=Cafeteria roenbergensis TaxID=33653 RepID=A0A5A8DSY4_CAFRO|nr:hypothetical protein FNF29_06087 [Cafeteria roenbergensis]KAA0168585.1 hypothetical protein FNF31_00465 [Cafeteria roenbergensis]KAA0171135.1 hypothetical protein FNF28_00902 [Cafeteria roenbergensis]|eukprot:KAA0149200.1 hypothetical protein FNF29_06087 [Cafeteria roenbergensis]
MAHGSGLQRPLLDRELSGGGYGGHGDGMPHGGLGDDAPDFDASILTDSPPVSAAAAFSSPGWDATSADSSRRPIILIAGPRRSGKTSIHHVVFHKLSPHETMFLGSTAAAIPELISHNELFQFEVWDLPGDYALTGEIRLDDGSTYTTEDALRRCGALLFVVDAQEGVDDDAAELLRDIGRRVAAHAPGLAVDVLIHKIDGDALQSPEARLEAQADVQITLGRALRDCGLGGLPVAFHASSVYDGSVYEAVSKVVQRLLPQRAAMTQMLDSFVTVCGFESAAIYDVVSKIHLARDSFARGEGTADLVGDTLDVVVDVACIYTSRGAAGQEGTEGTQEAADGAGAQASAAGEEAEEGAEPAEGDPEVDDTFQFDELTESVITLQDGHTMVLRSVGPYMALVAVSATPDVASGSRLGIVDCNVDIVRKALHGLFQGGAGLSPASKSGRPGDAAGLSGLVLPPPAGRRDSRESAAAGSINMR